MTKENYKGHIIENKRQASVKKMITSQDWKSLESNLKIPEVVS
mgnify:CR=1 FL=1